MIEEFTRRHLPFEQWFNVRDLGGYAADGRAIAWRQYYRAGAPSRLSTADIERARALGIRTVMDLRRDDETERDETRAEDALGAVTYRIPVVRTADALDSYVTGPGISAERYLAYLEVGGDAFRAVFELLGDPASYPVVVHCSAGKDRTGVVSAMALELLGVQREAIEMDYAMTNIERDRIAAFWTQRGGGWFAQATPEQIDFALSVPSGAIGGFLDGLQSRYGGAEAYLRGVGVSETAIRGLRQILRGRDE